MAQLPQYRLGDLERKLLTLLALQALGPCSNLQLIDFIAQSGLMNYFDLQTALHELSLAGQVIRTQVPGDAVFTLTPEGEEAINLFVSRLGESAREQVAAAAPAFREQMRKDRELYAQISHEGRNEYHAQLGIAEGSLHLLRLDLSLPTAELAGRFRDAWAEKARDIYDYIIATLSGEDLN